MKQEPFTIFTTQEPLQTVIERADANNCIFAINYDQATKRIHVEFHGSEEISLVEVDVEDLENIAAMFSKAARMLHK